MTHLQLMSGMPHYSSDIGGFTNAWDTISVPWNEYKGGPGVKSPELYTRWFQFGVFTLYEDDGTTMAYTKGEFKETTIKSVEGEDRLEISIEPSSGSYEGMVNERLWVLQINALIQANKVLVNGESVRLSVNDEKKFVEFSAFQKSDASIKVEVYY